MTGHPDSNAEPCRSPHDRLVAVQATLGLTMPDLARALQVSTQQLFEWFTPPDRQAPDDHLPPPTAKRLDGMERAANAWQARSAAPLRAVAHQPLADGRTFVDLLATEGYPDHALTAALDELHAMLLARPPSPSQRLAEAGHRRRPSIRALPSDA
jgi:hypothetical protein